VKSQQQEDLKANTRVVEIFMSHRNAWKAEEKRLGACNKAEGLCDVSHE